jgi:uncharacterized Zn-binding protein involved in type VI secretion
MGDAIVLAGDMFSVETTFGDATVKGKNQGNMQAVGGAGRVKIQGKPVCVEGDEKLSILLPGLLYTTAAFGDVPGIGLAKITALGPDQISKKVSVGGKKVILKGSKFTAEYKGFAPAQKISGPGVLVPDPTFAAKPPGQGKIDAKEDKVKAL